MSEQNSASGLSGGAALKAQPQEMKTSSYIYGVEVLDGNDAWALFEAAGNGDLTRVAALLEKDGRLVNAQYCYQFPLHRAVQAGHAEVVELLLARGADPGQSRYTYDSWDKLLRSARDAGQRTIESLLFRAMESRFNYRPRFDRLREAIVARDSVAIEQTIVNEPELVTASDALGNNALHWCVITRQFQWLRRFAELGTPIDALRADGNSPLLLAVNGATDYWYRDTRERTHPSIRNTSVLVGYLLALGARYSMSVAAAVGDQEQILKLLDEDSRQARQLDSSRISPLSRASRSGYLHIVRLLLDHGADPRQPEDCAPEGRALYEACCGNHISIAKLLLERGANPNGGVDSCECCLTIAEVYHGESAKPLQNLLLQHGACLPPYRMNTEQLKEAIRQGSMITRHDEFPRCVMQNCDAELLDLLLAAQPGVIEQLEVSDELTFLRDPELMQRLLSAGLNPTRRNWLGKTLIDVCDESGNHNISSLLRSFLRSREEGAT